MPASAKTNAAVGVTPSPLGAQRGTALCKRAAAADESRAELSIVE
jgi:hypothetical protein